MSPKITNMSPTSKGAFPAKYGLTNEKIPTKICKFLDGPVKAIVTVHMQSLLEQTDSTVWGDGRQEKARYDQVILDN